MHVIRGKAHGPSRGVAGLGHRHSIGSIKPGLERPAITMWRSPGEPVIFDCKNITLIASALVRVVVSKASE